MRHARPHQQSAVASAFDGELRGRGVLVRNKPFRRGDKIVEHVLFFELHAILMPLFAVLASPTKVCHGINPSHFKPRQVRHREARRDADIEPAVPIKQRRIFSVLLQTFFVSDKHRNARPVFAMIEDLFGFELRFVALNFGLTDDRGRAGFQVIPVNSPGGDETRERIERFAVLASATKAAGGA